MLCIETNGKSLAVGLKNGRVEIQNISDITNSIVTLIDHTSPVISIKFHEDSMLFTSSVECTYIYKDYKIIQTVDGYLTSINPVYLSF